MNFLLPESRDSCGNRPVQAGSLPQEPGRQEMHSLLQ
jgi:hypothetical protein